MKYKISTIIPVYNSEKYLSQCIESLLNQTYKNIELIIIDDGSTDNSLKIIKEYANKDNRIKYYHQENKGGNVALNFGITQTTGDLIHFLDSDDYIESNAYEIIIDEFNKHPEIDSCLFSYKTVDEKGNISKNSTKNKTMYTSIYKNPETLIWFSSAQWRKVTKKDLIIKNNIMFDNTFFGYDVLFHLNILKTAKKVSILSNQFIYYRVGDQNSSSGRLTRSKDYYIHLQCFEHCVNLYKDMPRNIYDLNISRQFEICFDYFNNSLNEYKLKNYFIFRDFLVKADYKLINAILLNNRTKNMYYNIINFCYIYDLLICKENELNIIKKTKTYKFAKKLSNLKRRFFK